MDEEKYQKELFEFEKPKRFFPKLSDFFPKGDFERNVILTLTLDRAVFIAIGIIMAMVALYALGVEAGRSRAAEEARVIPVPVAIAPQAVKVTVQQPVIKTQIVAKVPAKPIPAPALSNVSKPYTIVVATFTSKEIAIQEIDKLKKQGYNAMLRQSDSYFQVCIGAYADKTVSDTQKDLKKIKRLYKDAYIKLR